jgi:hypothetical protein
MNQVLIEPALKPAPFRPIAAKFGVLVALAALLAGGLWVTKGPDFVNHVSVTNKTGYDLNVDVTTAKHDGWMPISVATGGATTVTRDVIDQRDTWVFRFSYAGRNAGEISVPRSELAKNGWRIVVPDQVAKNLGDAGILPGQ